LRDQSGYALIAFLIIMPILIMLMIVNIEATDTVTVSDINVQDGLASACKAAAGQIIDAAQANGTPRINSANALNEFETSLEENLGLGNGSNGQIMMPVTNSHFMGTPQVYFLAYNGYNDYTANGGDECDYWSITGSDATPESITTPAGFPATFYVTDTGINTSSGTYKVVLNSPGVIAVITIQKVLIMGNVPVVVNRWASARIVWQSS
jgi:Flp pilus assembly protein TadG